jgi:hypothetical protein
VTDPNTTEPAAALSVDATVLGWKPGEWKPEVEYAGHWYLLSRVDRNAENEVVSGRYLGVDGSTVLVVTK